MKRHISTMYVIASFSILLLASIISVQIYVSRKVLPQEYIYDISYLLSMAEKTSWEQPSKLSDIIKAYEVVCSEWCDNPHEQTYNYMKKYHSFIFCFAYDNSFYYVDCLSGNYFVSPLFNPCEISGQNETDESQSVQKWVKASRFWIMVESTGNYVWDAQDCLDTILFQMNKELSLSFSSVNYLCEFQECRYDYINDEFTNYCTGEGVPQEITDIVIPYLTQIKMTYPSVDKIKFCAKLPIKKM